MSHKIVCLLLIVGDMSTTMPNPSLQQVTAWLEAASQTYLQEEGWRDASFRFPGIISAAQAFAKEHFGEQLEQQEAFFDGIALALAALGHFSDIEQVSALLRTESTMSEQPPQQLPAHVESRQRTEATTTDVA